MNSCFISSSFCRMGKPLLQQRCHFRWKSERSWLKYESHRENQRCLAILCWRAFALFQKSFCHVQSFENTRQIQIFSLRWLTFEMLNQQFCSKSTCARPACQNMAKLLLLSLRGISCKYLLCSRIFGRICKIVLGKNYWQNPSTLYFEHVNASILQQQRAFEVISSISSIWMHRSSSIPTSKRDIFAKDTSFPGEDWIVTISEQSEWLNFNFRTTKID